MNLKVENQTLQKKKCETLETIKAEQRQELKKTDLPIETINDEDEEQLEEDFIDEKFGDDRNADDEVESSSKKKKKIEDVPNKSQDEDEMPPELQTIQDSEFGKEEIDETKENEIEELDENEQLSTQQDLKDDEDEVEKNIKQKEKDVGKKDERRMLSGNLDIKTKVDEHIVEQPKEIPTEKFASQIEEYLQEQKVSQKKFLLQMTPRCIKGAEKMVKLFGSRTSQTHHLYHQIFEKVIFLKSAQNGRYCFLCNEAAKEFVDSPTEKEQGKVKFSKDFCTQIVKKVLPVTVRFKEVYNPFLKALFDLLSCVVPLDYNKVSSSKNKDDKKYSKEESIDRIASDSPNIDFTKEDSEILEELMLNPLGMHNRSFNECLSSSKDGVYDSDNCREFCEEFNFASKLSLYDGSILSQSLVYKTLTKFEFALKNPKKNIFNDNIDELKAFIKESIANISQDDVLMFSNKKGDGLESYSTVIGEKGIDPFEFKVDNYESHRQIRLLLSQNKII